MNQSTCLILLHEQNNPDLQGKKAYSYISILGKVEVKRVNVIYNDRTCLHQCEQQ